MSALTVTIGADTSAMRAAFQNATRQVADFGGKLKAIGSTGAFAAAAVPIAAVGAALAGSLAIMREYAEYDGLVRSLKTLDGTSEATTARLAKLRDVAKLPGLGFEEAVRGDVRLRSAGISAKLSEAALRAFGNALATVGAGKDELGGVILALTQISAKGKVSAEEINQLAERLPQIRAAMKGAFGTADTEVLSKLGITSEKFIQGIVTQLAKLPAVTGGARNAVENFDDTWKAFKVSVSEVALPVAAAILTQLSNGLKEWTAAVREFKSVMGMQPEALQGKAGKTEGQRQADIAAEKASQEADRVAKQAQDVAGANFDFWEDLAQKRIAIDRERAAKQVQIEEERQKKYRELEERGYATQLSEMDNLQRRIENLKASGEYGSSAVAGAVDSGVRNQIAERTVQIQELQKELADLQGKEKEKADAKRKSEETKEKKQGIRLDPIVTSLGRVGGGGYGYGVLDAQRENNKLTRQTNEILEKHLSKRPTGGGAKFS